MLTPNIFYRISRSPVFRSSPISVATPRASDSEELHRSAHAGRDGARQLGIAIDFLASQPFVGLGPMGVVGFCFAGKFALLVAAARPDRVAAAASFHGGGLFTDTIYSPHLVLPRVKAQQYALAATNDLSMNAEAIEKFESTTLRSRVASTRARCTMPGTAG